MLSKARISYVRSLHMKKFRAQHQEFIAEGPKIALELLESRWEVTGVFATADWIGRHDIPGNITVHEIQEKELQRISALKNPQEVLITVRMPSGPLPPPTGDLILILDRMSDPGNLGTIIRTADWFGIRYIVCSEDSAELFNPKVIQASMGSFLRVALDYRDLSVYLQERKDLTVYGAFMDGQPVKELQPSMPAAILIGNESTGISKELTDQVHYRVSIPSWQSKAESLNAAVAAGILMDGFRQKIQRG